MAKKILPVKKAATKEKVVEIALKDMTADELKNKAKDLVKKIAKLNVEKTTGKTKNVRQAFTMRHELARVLTVLNSKKMS
jgi:ribosomal protein L29